MNSKYDHSTYVGMRNRNGQLISSHEFVSAYPVNVFNINMQLIGQASTKDEFIKLWNSDPANKTIGELNGNVWRYGFQIQLKAIPPTNNYVVGEPIKNK